VGYRPFRPFGGLFANMKARFAAAHCAPVGCDPCEPVAACAPCEPIACAPDPCDPCGAGVVGYRPFRPFGGLFAALKAKHACAPGCDPCEPVGCDPCVAVCRH
jgi:hypothetical protein